jgi:ADP-heptose:LPS heptosyltransferase
MKRKCFKLLSWGGVGDSLLSTPTFRTLKEQYPDCKISVLCTNATHYDVFKYNPDIDKLLKLPKWVTKLNEVILYFLFKMVDYEWLSYGLLRPSLYYQKPAAKIVGELLNIEVKNTKPYIYLTLNEEIEARRIVSQYKNPIAINPTSRTTKNQEWSLEQWERLVKKMPDVTFIQLGLKDETYIQGAIDYRGKTSLRMSIAMLKYMKGFVGVETFLGHAAVAVDVPSVILFGPSNPAIWGYDSNHNIYKSCACSPCVDYLGADECPYNKLCMSMIEVKEVENSIKEKILKTKIEIPELVFEYQEV